MDLERFIANRELLERLSREYELLKASGADVNYAAWVRQRLREAAAELAAATVGASARNRNVQRGDSYEILAGGAVSTTAINEQSALPVEITAAPTVDIPAQQLAFSRRSGPSGVPVPAARLKLDGSGGVPTKPETAWFLRGEGSGPASEALATAIYGPSAQMPRVTVPTLSRAVKASRNKASKRVVIISPRKSPLQPPQRTSPNQQQQQQQQSARPSPPVCKLFTRVESGPFSAKPETYVHPQVRARRTQSATMRPDWVNAASLQAALRGASSAIPHLQAAAERERRLALSTALARQTLAAGLGQDEARAVALYGSSPAATAAQAAQYDHVLQVARQLAQQNEQLALAVQLNSAQLAQQQAVLESALQQQPQQQWVPNKPTAVRARQEPAGIAASSSKVEAEPEPPRRSLRRGSCGPAAANRQGKGDFLVTKITHAPPVSNAGTAKSPVKAGTRSRSPAMGALTVPESMPVGAAPIGTTAAERERSSRRDALKALLKQVLNGAGLAGGREGRRRLATSMAEAEKLVAAIHALARTKAGLDGTGDREQATKTTPPAVMSLAVAETQTSRPVSVASAGGEGEGAPAATAGAQAKMSRQTSHASSLAGSRSAASDKDAASVGIAPGPRPRPLSRQGSGLTSGSAGSEPQSAAGPGGASAVQALPSVPVTMPESLEPSEAGAPSKAASEESLGVPGHAKDVLLSSASSTAAQEASARAASLTSSAAAQRSQIGLATEGSKQISASEHSEAITTTSAKASKSSGSAAARAQVPSAAAGGVAQGTLPLQGIAVESLEDQVQQIVERDAAAAAEMVRLQKLDALEQRLHSMVDRVETKFARVLQPIQLNAPQAGSLGPSTWELHPSSTAAGTRGPADVDPEAIAASRATGKASLTAVAAAVAAAAGARAGVGSSHRDVPGAGLGSRAISGHNNGGAYVSGAEVMSPRSAGISVLELQRMLIDLNRMESKEQEIRRKWFFDSKASPRQRGRVAHPIVVRDGQLGALDQDDIAAGPPPVPLAPHFGRAISPRPIHWSIPQPPTESALATIAVGTSRRIVSGPSTGPRRDAAVGSGGNDASSVQAQDGTAAADQALEDPINDSRLESVLRGRRRFLRAQKLADGDLLAAAVPSLNPVQIMEDLTDALLDELLHEQAQELGGLCDNLGEHMFKDEFDLSDDDDRR